MGNIGINTIEQRVVGLKPSTSNRRASVMNSRSERKAVTLSVVIPCYNEASTLEECVNRVLEIGSDTLHLKIIIVDDASGDTSFKIARELSQAHPNVSVLKHEINQGKGAALRSGFQEATGDFVAVQDADLEYDPKDLKRLLEPLLRGDADVVIGSRFLSTGAHRVLYFWHYLGNRLLTFLSNMFTDLNLTDMETCYKVFRRDVIQQIEIQENRFGFEPEIVAKVAHMRLRIYEMGISYYGRTYAEGKKIGAKDGLRAMYCVFRYNAYQAPLPVQFLLYLAIGGIAAIANLTIFLVLHASGLSVWSSAPIAFLAAAILNYLLCVLILFRHRARWRSGTEILVYTCVVGIVGVLDVGLTSSLMSVGAAPAISKFIATLVGLVLNFSGRRYLVFPEPVSGPWRSQR
jgi:glycosyltransferase involved in cell wall biosynthesis